MDVEYYFELKTEVYFPITDHRLPKYWMFPLKRRPFGLGTFFYAPAKPMEVLRAFTNVSTCKTHIFDHRRYVPLKNVTSVPCQELHSCYPFVHRQPGRVKTEAMKGGKGKGKEREDREAGISKGCNETLVIDGRVLSSYWTEDYYC